MSSPRVMMLKSVGVVKTKASREEVSNKTYLSKIVINKEFTKALEGLSGFSHVFVIFLMHEVAAEERKTLQVHPKGRKDLPLVGVFATRSPTRPNPLGLTLVELMSIKGNVMTVRGLDAFDGTPVLDIKPYRRIDMSKEAKFPQWMGKLDFEEA